MEFARRKICIVTGTRAEYGLMSRLMRMIKDSDTTTLQLVAANMHLSPKYGETYKEIEADGFTIDWRVPIIDEQSEDNALTTVFSMSKALAGFAEAYDNLKPDMLVVLGDRYEILAAATAALIMRIPIAHISGGDVTEGAYDDAIRHSITKMSHLHFPSTEEYRKRVIQLGQQPDRVFNVGALGVENIKRIPLLGKEEIEKDLDFKIDDKTILVTYHPVTLGGRTAKEDIDDFIAALEERKDLRVIFTMPNSDTGSQFIVDAINKFDPDKNVKFKTYAVTRIRGSIFDELRELDWVPRSVRQKSREIEDTIVELESKLGRTATDSEIAKEMGMTETEYQNTIMKVSGTSVLSLNDVWYSGDDGDHMSIGDNIESPASLNPDVIVEREEVRKVIIEAINELPKNEKMVIVLYYNEDLTFREIGQVLNVSESRISQLHTKANMRLRAKLTSLRKGIF